MQNRQIAARTTGLVFVIGLLMGAGAPMAAVGDRPRTTPSRSRAPSRACGNPSSPSSTARVRLLSSAFCRWTRTSAAGVTSGKAPANRQTGRPASARGGTPAAGTSRLFISFSPTRPMARRPGSSRCPPESGSVRTASRSVRRTVPRCRISMARSSRKCAGTGSRRDSSRQASKTVRGRARGISARLRADVPAPAGRESSLGHRTPLVSSRLSSRLSAQP